jgi:hypothetical protein
MRSISLISFHPADFFRIVEDDETKTKKDKTVSLAVPFDDSNQWV